MTDYGWHKYAAVPILATGFLAAFSVFAVGGGGGGSVPSCTQDEWSCTGWSQCGSDGTQIRNCSLTFDCPTANTPKPAESQACAPPAPPKVAPSEKPISEPVPPVPSCAADRFTCSDWSETCDTFGREHRTCNISFDCPGVITPPPASFRPCQKLQCGNLPTLRERVFCRLNLAPAGVARELEIQYLPEACRVKNGEERKECIGLYKSYQSCWSAPQGEERFACARRALALGPVISEEIKTCQGKTGAEQVLCKKEVREKVLYMISFRFYDLEQRAEDLGNRGASLEAIADFVTLVEMKKQEFEAAKTNAERRQIILDVRAAWREFVNKVNKVKEQVK